MLLRKKAAIDVNDAFDDDFMSSFILLSPKRVLNDEGIWETRGFSSIILSGVVEAPLGLNTTPSGEQNNGFVKGAVNIYCKHKLNCQTDTTPADHIIINNKEYIVNDVRDCGIYGRGFYIASCYLVEDNDGEKLFQALEHNAETGAE